MDMKSCAARSLLRLYFRVKDIKRQVLRSKDLQLFIRVKVMQGLWHEYIYQRVNHRQR